MCDVALAATPLVVSSAHASQLQLYSSSRVPQGVPSWNGPFTAPPASTVVDNLQPEQLFSRALEQLLLAEQLHGSAWAA